MRSRATIYTIVLLACAVTAFSFVPAGADAGSSPTRAHAIVALRDLQSDFHGASTLGDRELLRSLWAADAVVFAGGGVHRGLDEIEAFFSSGPNWGNVASLAPTYRTQIDVFGHIALLQFECILVNVGDLNTETTPLSTIPFGGQNPDATIVQHSTATCVAVRERGAWRIKLFVGTAGPEA